MKLAIGVALASVVLIGCEKAAPPGPVQELKLPTATYKVGDQQAKTEELVMAMRFAPPGGGKVSVEMTQRNRERQEILAVDAAGIPTKLEIAYLERDETQRMGSRSETETSPLAGKTYVVWREGDLVKVTRDDGTEPPPDEMQEVIDEHRMLGTPDAMDRLVASKTWRTGHKIAFTADELAEANAVRAAANSTGDREELAAVELTLRRLDRGVAHFDVRLGFDITTAHGDVKMTIDGTARVDSASGQLGEVGGKGPVRGQVTGMPFTGEVTMTMRAE